MTESIQYTLELTCVSNGFDYSQYIALHNKRNYRAVYLTEKGYAALQHAFNTEVKEISAYAPSNEENITDPWEDFNG